MDRRPEGESPERDVLEHALSSPDPGRRAAAILRATDALGVEPLLTGALGDPAPEVRRAAVSALGRLLRQRVGKTDPLDSEGLKS